MFLFAFCFDYFLDPPYQCVGNYKNHEKGNNAKQDDEIMVYVGGVEIHAEQADNICAYAKEDKG